MSRAHSEEFTSYPKILQWSVDKISESRRRKTGIDLRRNLLVANVIYKARSGILQMRARQFLKDKPQLQPPAPVKEPEPPASAFGYAEVPSGQSPAPPAVGPVDLSASTEAIVISSVQLSIQGLDEDPKQEDPKQEDPKQECPPEGTRKRRRRRPAPLQLAMAMSLPTQELTQPTPMSPPKRSRVAAPSEEVRVLQNSFLDLSVAAAEQRGGCATQDPFGLFGCPPSLPCPS